jgi:hypothetical protein
MTPYDAMIFAIELNNQGKYDPVLFLQFVAKKRKAK